MIISNCPNRRINERITVEKTPLLEALTSIGAKLPSKATAPKFDSRLTIFLIKSAHVSA